MSDVTLNWEKISRSIGKRERTRNRGYKEQELQRMEDYADLRGKMIIEILSSTGMRIDALSTIQFQHLTPVTMKGQPSYAFLVYAGEPEEYVVPCTPRCRTYIDRYSEYRVQKGARVTPIPTTKLFIQTILQRSLLE